MLSPGVDTGAFLENVCLISAEDQAVIHRSQSREADLTNMLLQTCRFMQATDGRCKDMRQLFAPGHQKKDFRPENIFTKGSAKARMTPKI